MTATAGRKRAIGIVRVSQVNRRDEERGFASPSVQRQRIADLCAREGLQLVDTRDEMDVSGGKTLGRRTGLVAAIEAVEARQADVIVVAYFDRLIRSLEVQAQVLRRVEDAGGRVLAADVGEVSNDTAAKWLSATMHGMVAEYHNRITAEKAGAAQRQAIAKGIPPMILPPHLRRDGDTIVVDESRAQVVAEAVRLRAEGASVREVGEHLAANGIHRSHNGVTTLLRSRMLVGEIVFGANRKRPEDVWRGACPAIVDREVWERAQKVSVPRGRRPKSDRLLARLGVLRCGTCGSRMVVGTSNNSGYYLYRCPPTGDCPQRVTVSADLVEGVVTERVRTLLAGIEGTASSDQPVREAAAGLDRAQRDLDAAIRAFSGLNAEPAAIERLAELRQARDDAREHHERLAAAQVATSIAVTVGDWDRLILEERRDLIRAVIERVEVRPGRGAERVTVVDRGA